MPASALVPAVVIRREPLDLRLNSVRPISEDITRDPVSIAPQAAPEPLPSPRAEARSATTWIRAWIDGMPRWQEDRFLGRLYQLPPNAAKPRGAQIPFVDPANIYLPPSTAYGSHVEIG